MTAAAILSRTMLVDTLVEELLCTWHVTPAEALTIAQMVEEWGDEKRPPGWGQPELRAEIARRIHEYLLTKRGPSVLAAEVLLDRCANCARDIESPFGEVFMGGVYRTVCSQRCADEAVACSLCQQPCAEDDRLPLENGGEQTKVHFACVAKLGRARGYERQSVLIRRSGPAFGVVRGGKAS